MSEKTALAMILVGLAAFAGGWYAHRELRPFLTSSSPTGDAALASPDRPASKSQVIFDAQGAVGQQNKAMRVDRVTVLQEQPDSLLMEIRYHYSGPAPAQEVKLFVGMGSKYLYLGNETVQAGDGVMRVPIGLIDTDMAKDGVKEFSTSRMSVSFEHYPPGAYMGVLASDQIPYAKIWRLR